jgi:hypothetical protein
MQGVRSARRCGVVVFGAAVLLLALPCAPVTGAELDWSSVNAGGSLGSGGGHRLGATVGQGDANVRTAPGVVLVGGFWAIVRARAAAPTPTPTASATATGSAAASGTATASRSPTPTVTGTGGVQPTATMTTSPGATPTATPLPTTVAASPTPTATVPPGCVGDCNGDGQVRVAELVTLVNIALDLQALDACPAGDRNDDGRLTIDEVLIAVNHALGSCPEEGALQ